MNPNQSQDLNLTHNMSFDQIECAIHKLKEHLAWMILCKDKVTQNKVLCFLDWHKHMKEQVMHQQKVSEGIDRKADLDLLIQQLNWLEKRLTQEFTVTQKGQMGGAAKKAKKTKSKSKSKSKSKGKKASAKPKAKAPAKAKATKSKSKSKSKSKGKKHATKRA